MTSAAVLTLLAERLDALAAATPDLAQLRVLAAYSQALLKAIEVADLDARIARLEAMK